MSRRQSADALGHRVEPTGWNISLSPPKGFVVVDKTSNRSGFEVRFRGEDSDGRPLVLLFQGVAAGDSVLGLGDRNEGTSRESAVSTPDFVFGFVSRLSKNPRKRIGTLPGAEVTSRDGGTVVRAAVAAGGDRFAVVLSAGRGKIDQPLYELFDLVCESVRYIAG